MEPAAIDSRGSCSTDGHMHRGVGFCFFTWLTVDLRSHLFSVLLKNVALGHFYILSCIGSFDKEIREKYSLIFSSGNDIMNILIVKNSPSFHWSSKSWSTITDRMKNLENMKAACWKEGGHFLDLFLSMFHGKNKM